VIKYIFGTLFILLTLAASAQKKSVVLLIESKSTERIVMSGRDVVKVYKGVFKQDYSIMHSDSAYFYVAENAFDAFGHVNITQGDTLNIYSDKLNYNGNTKIAILTDNVRMIDKDAILTTNYLTYNTATRIGTYTGGGKLVNKDNTLTSKNGYYFAFSRDAFFRYNVVLVTPDALIKTDTLRYNSGSRIAYFYGPTNIYDSKDKKDTLYTENGLYNTVTEQAFFGKKNLYKQGTKTLTGDSLFYDKLKGYGRAVKRVTFRDREQDITLKGDLATYYKAGERTIVTQDPYVIIVTENKDTTKTDTVPVKPGVKQANPIAVKNAAPKKLNALTNQPPAGTIPVKMPVNIPVKADTVIKARIDTLTKTVLANKTAVKNAATEGIKKANAFATKPPPGTIPIKKAGKTLITTDTLIKPVAADKKVKRDSIYISADTLETEILTYKDLKIMQEKQRLSGVRDTTVKAKKLSAAEQKKADKFLSISPPKWRNDTSYLHPNFFGKPKPQANLVAAANGKGKPADKGTGAPTVDGKQPDAKQREDDVDNDLIFYTKPVVLSDTARVRIIKAYHGAKLFKSDLQAKADSMFYSNSDSTLRCFVQPLIWTQGSQLSGDTITMQMKNKKLDNLNLSPSSFIVNIEPGDSTNFNQVAGKKMKGFFKNDKLDRMYIVGNAESIYYSRDSLKKVDGMQRSLSSRMKVYFKNGSANNIFFTSKPEHRYGPLAKFTEDERILKGFIWKPKERPISKESILPSYNRRFARAKAAADKKAAGTAKDKAKTPGSTLGKDSLNTKNTLPAGTKAAKDSLGTVKQPVMNTPGTKVKQDSTGSKKPSSAIIKPVAKPNSTSNNKQTPITKLVADTVKGKPAVVIKTKKDTVAVKP
jgi:lipopolysaccharide export system protein LptA